MALSEKHRSSIYRTIAPLIGEEEAQALMAQFPARDIDEPVSREFVHAEIIATRAELQAEIGSLRSEMLDGFGSLRSEMRDLMASQTRWTVGTIIAAGAGYTALMGFFAGLA